MSNQDLNQILKNDPIVMTRNMPKSEALKGVTAGELVTMKEATHSIEHKKYVEKSDGSFDIWLYGRNNDPIIFIPDVPLPEVLKVAMEGESITQKGTTRMIALKRYIEELDGTVTISLYTNEQ